MAATRIMPLHIGKGRDVATAIADIAKMAEEQRNLFSKWSIMTDEQKEELFHLMNTMKLKKHVDSITGNNVLIVFYRYFCTQENITALSP